MLGFHRDDTNKLIRTKLNSSDIKESTGLLSVLSSLNIFDAQVDPHNAAYKTTLSDIIDGLRSVI